MSSLVFASTNKSADLAFSEGNYAKALALYMGSAKEGDADSMACIGVMYDQGFGVEIDKVEAANWYRKSADRGNKNGQYFLGLKYLIGEGVAQNKGLGAVWIRKAAEQGLADAQSRYGEILRQGEGVEADPEEGWVWTTRAAENGDPMAQLYLGVSYMGGDEVAVDLKKGVWWLLKSGNQGNPVAQYLLGLASEKGAGTQPDMQAAVRWYRASADQGNMDAQFSLAKMLLAGKGVKRDVQEAIRMVRDAASQGHVEAQSLYGMALFVGEWLPRDARKGVMWIKKAAEQGNLGAQYILGDIYRSGADGISVDKATAAYWYREAAVKGHLESQYSIGSMLYKGDGIPQDKQEAAVWFRKAAELGQKDAQTQLSYMLSMGEAIRKDQAEAVKWLRLAANAGQPTAQFNLAATYARGDGVPIDTKAALNWYYKAGVTYLGQGDFLNARKCLERIQLNATDDHPLAVKLSDAISGNSESAKEATSYPRNQGEREQQDDTGSDDDARENLSTGTGWIAEGGYIVTAAHVIENKKEIVGKLSDGKPFPLELAQIDKVNDLAILTAGKKQKLPAGIPISRSRAKTGTQVFTLGFPHAEVMGLNVKLSSGQVSSETGMADDPRFLQVTVPVQSGNSGGPLLNMKGEVVGIMVGKLNALKMAKASGDLTENVNYAVKVGHLVPLAMGFEKDKKSPVLPSTSTTLDALVERVKGSVILIIAR